MRIALVNTSLEKGRGSDVVVHDLATHLSKRHDVTVYSLRPVDDESRSYRLVTPSRGVGRIKLIAQAWRTLRAIARDAAGFDVINSHHALVSLFLPRARLVTTYHGYRGRMNLSLGSRLGSAISELIRWGPVRLALNRSRGIAVVSSSLAKEAERSGSKNWRVIYNGVEKLPSHPELEPTHFLYLGRLDPDKSVGTLLAAYERARLPVPLLVVGDGAERTQLETRYAAPNLRFLGKCSREELPALFAGAFAFATASEFETFCLPVIEAAQFGCPSIGPASGALPEVIRADETGLLAETGQLSEKIETLWKTPLDKRKAMQNACREWAETFSWERAVAAYEMLYRSVSAIDGLDGRNAAQDNGTKHT